MDNIISVKEWYPEEVMLFIDIKEAFELQMLAANSRRLGNFERDLDKALTPEYLYVLKCWECGLEFSRIRPKTVEDYPLQSFEKYCNQCDV